MSVTHDVLGVRLTPRERDVLRLVARGLTSRQAAHRLHLSVRTVDNHVQAVLRRTGAANRTTLVLLLVRRGLL